MSRSLYLCKSLMIVLAGCATPRADLQRFEFRQIHMGVEARIVLFSADSTHAVVAARAAYARIASLDAIMSDYRSDSELRRLTETVDTPVRVSDPLWEVLALGQQMARISTGAFDITAGPLILLWRESRGSGLLPTEAALDSARSRTGWQRLELDSARHTARLATEGMRLDLGGIGKGYAVDAAINALREHGVNRALVEFGGDIAVSDPPPGQRGWRVRLAEAAGAPPSLLVANAAISTSGDGAQFVDIEGERYSHVIDPRTGVALHDGVVATVIAARGRLSDPLATVLGVLGPEVAQPFLDRYFPDVRAYVRRIEYPGAPD